MNVIKWVADAVSKKNRRRWSEEDAEAAIDAVMDVVVMVVDNPPSGASEEFLAGWNMAIARCCDVICGENDEREYEISSKEKRPRVLWLEIHRLREETKWMRPSNSQTQDRIPANQ